MGGLPNEKSVVGYRLSGQAQTLTLQGAGTSVSTTLVSAVAMDGTGQLASRTYGNRVSRQVSYDSATRQLTGLSASFETGSGETLATNFIQADSFTRDALGRITQIELAWVWFRSASLSGRRPHPGRSNGPRGPVTSQAARARRPRSTGTWRSTVAHTTSGSMRQYS